MIGKVKHYSNGDEVVFGAGHYLVETSTDEDGEQWIVNVDNEGDRVIAHVDDLSYVDPLEY